MYVKNHKQSAAGEAYAQKLASLKRVAFVKKLVDNATDTYVLVDAQQKELGVYHASGNRRTNRMTSTFRERWVKSKKKRGKFFFVSSKVYFVNTQKNHAYELKQLT